MPGDGAMIVLCVYIVQSSITTRKLGKEVVNVVTIKRLNVRLNVLLHVQETGIEVIHIEGSPLAVVSTGTMS